MCYVYVWVALGFSISVPSLASVSAISFPVLPECARTLCMWTICGLYMGSNIFGVQWLLLVVCRGGGVVMSGDVCDYELGICYFSCL